MVATRSFVRLLFVAVYICVVAEKGSGAPVVEMAPNHCIQRSKDGHCIAESNPPDPTRSEVVGSGYTNVLSGGQKSVFLVYLRDSQGRPVDTTLAGIAMAAETEVKERFEGKTTPEAGGVLRTEYTCGHIGFLKWSVHVKGVHIRGSPFNVACDVFVPPESVRQRLAVPPAAPMRAGGGVGDRVAYATLVTKKSYVPGALVLHHTLLQAMARGGRHAPVLALVTEGLPASSVNILHEAGMEVRPVPLAHNPTRTLFSSAPPFEGWSDVFSKLHAWNMTDFDRIVMMDADALVVGDPTPLLSMEELSAAPEGAGPGLAFNSGVLVLRPSADTHAALMSGITSETVTFDGADQGYLNEFFVDRWNIIPYRYNLLRSPLHYRGQSSQFWWYTNRHFDRSVVLHLTGPKPWQCGRHRECSDDGHSVPAFSRLWFEAWDAMCHAGAGRITCVEQYDNDATGINVEKFAVRRVKKNNKNKNKNKKNKNKGKESNIGDKNGSGEKGRASISKEDL